MHDAFSSETLLKTWTTYVRTYEALLSELILPTEPATFGRSFVLWQSGICFKRKHPPRQSRRQFSVWNWGWSFAACLGFLALFYIPLYPSWTTRPEIHQLFASCLACNWLVPSYPAWSSSSVSSDWGWKEADYAKDASYAHQHPDLDQPARPPTTAPWMDRVPPKQAEGCQPTRGYHRAKGAYYYSTYCIRIWHC